MPPFSHSSIGEDGHAVAGPAATDARLLADVQAIAIIVTILGGAGMWLISRQPGVLMIFGVATLAQLAAWLLMRRGRVRAGAWLLACLLWLHFTALSTVQGGQGSEQSLGHLLVIILAVVLLGTRPGLLFLLLSIGWQLVLAFGLSEWFGMYLLVPQEAWPLWASISVFFVMSYMLLALATRNLRRALDDSRQVEERYRSLFEQSNDAIFIQGLELPFRTSANQRAAELLGYSVEELSARSLNDLTTTSERAADGALLERLLAGDVLPPFERRLVRKEGLEILVEINASLINDRHGRPVYLQSIVRNITERKRIETELREIQQRYQALFESTNDAVYLMDLDLIHVAANPQGAEMLGYRMEEIIGRNALDFIVPAETAPAINVRAALLAGRKLPIYERTLMRKDGSQVTAEVSAGLVYGPDGQPLYIQTVLRDITWRKKVEDQLTQSLMETELLARTDALTGLKNRRAVEEYAAAQLQRALREHTPLSLVMLDMDQLKQINDTYGHQAGDIALKHFASLLSEGIRAYDVAGRWAGDEFILVLPGARLGDARAMAERLQVALRQQPVQVEGAVLTLQASMGVAAVPEDGERKLTLDDLVRWADEALYAAKQADRGQVRVYELGGGAPPATGDLLVGE